MQKKEAVKYNLFFINNKLIHQLIFFHQFPSTSVKTVAVWSFTVIYKLYSFFVIYTQDSDKTASGQHFKTSISGAVYSAGFASLLILR